MLSLIFCGNTVSSQSFEDFMKKNADIADSSKFAVKIENLNFLKNNEYFNDFGEGYTLIGYFLKPQIAYRPHKKLSIFAGIHLQKYSGMQKFAEILPAFTVEYRPTNNISLVFGELRGSINHNLTDFVSYNEYVLTQNSENGLQMLFNYPRIKSDIWINWMQYIFKDSPFPEKFLFGISNEIKLFETNKKSALNAKLSIVASHVGGQIDISEVPIETIINTISGLEYCFKINKKYLNEIKLFSHYHSCYDASPNKRLDYLYGYGIFSGVELANKYFDLKLAHWFAEYYFSKYGNPMFQSISQTKTYSEDQRAFANAHFFWTYQPLTFVKLGAGIDLYYDLYNYKTDYSFGFYIKTNFNFKIKKIKK